MTNLIEVGSFIFESARLFEVAGEAQQSDVARVVPLRLVSPLRYGVVKIVRPRFAQRMPAFLAIVRSLVPHFADEELGFGPMLLNPFLRSFSDLRYRLRVFLRSYGNGVFQSVLPSFFRLGRRLWKRHKEFRFRSRNCSGFFLGTVRAVEIHYGTSGKFSRPLSRDDIENLSADIDSCGDLRGGLDSFTRSRFLVLRFL